MANGSETWTVASGSWSTPSNWSGAYVPDGTTNVTIDATTTANSPDVVTEPGGLTATSASLTLAGPVSLLGTFTTGSVFLSNYAPSLMIGANSTLTDAGAFNANYGSAFTVNGGSLTAGVLAGSNLTETLNGGSITVAAIQAASGYNASANRYTVTAGIYRVTGDLQRGLGQAGDTFLISGNSSSVNGGQFLVGGTVSLGGDTVSAVQGGVIQFTSISTLANGSDTFTVDASSSIEIGSGTGPTAGAFTLDANQRLVDGGTITAPTIVNNGIIEVGPNESLALNGTGTGLIGSGSILIDAGSSLSVQAVGRTSQNTIAFSGQGGMLSLSIASLNADQAFLPTISGFNATDLIEYGGTVTSATYAGGVLTLHNGTSTVATLTLTGNYANASFFANALPSGGTQISVSTGGDTATAPTGTASADQYVWGASIAGSWDVPGNWIDTTNGANPAAVAPGLHDLVAIAAAAGVIDVVTGTGNAASLTLSGSVDLKGHFSTAAVALSGTTLVDAAASLTDSGDLVNAASYASLTVAGGTLTVTGNVVDYYYDRQTLNGGTITVGGIKASASNSSLYVGSSYTVTAGSYTVTGSIAETGTSVSVSGGSFTAKGTTDLGGDDFSTSGSGTIRLYAVLPTAGSSDNFYVSDNSSIEIGTTGGAAAGSFTLDQATSLVDGGSIYAPHIVINGTLEVGAGQTLQLVGGTGGYNSQNQYVYSGGLTGTGTILIDTNAELDVDRAVDPASGNTITFASGSTGGVLYLDPQTLTAAGAFLPVIAGFGPADLIDYGGTVTSATYASGVLTLHNGASTVATLTLTGNYVGSTFIANALPNGGTQISVSSGGDTATPPPGTATPDNYTWNAIKGSWDVPGNWIDTTNGANPAAVAPGLHDLVAIAAAAGVIDVVTGTGNAASLTLSGSVDLKGHFSTAAVALSGTTLVDAAASLTDSGDLVNAASYASLTVAGGTLTVTGNVVDYYYDRQTLNGGTITVGGIKASASNSSLYVGSSYTVTAGSYTVTGSIAETGTSVSVSGGSFTAKGTTDLGGDDFSTSGSGTIRLYAVLPTAGSSDNFYVSDNSSIEIGTTGGAAAGSFTLDQATSLIDGGSIYAPHIVINGTLEVGAGQTLQLVGGTGGYNSQNQYVYSGGLTGTGTILIDTNAELDVDRAVDPASGNTITFASGSTGGVLYLDPQTLTAAGAFLPVIAGFGPADLIEYGGTVTSATYAGGVLTLHNGTSTVATLTLTGNYANASFFANALPSGGTQISVSTGGDTATAPTGTASADQYVWGASIAGSWDVPGNWIDTTNGANPAAVAPGLHDLVAIAAAAGVIDVVTGTGNAASLTLSGSVDLKGHFSTAAVALSGTTLVDAAASLTDSGDLVNAASYASLTVAGGTLTVTGNVVDYYDRQTLNGGTITVGGIKASASNSSLYVGSSYTVTAGSYTVTGSIAETGTSVSVSGGSFTAKGTTDLGGDDFSTSGSGTIRLYAVLPTAGSSDNFYVSDNSSIEIGTTGGAAAGSFTLDQATSLIDGGSIYAPHIVINGTLEVGAGQTLQLVGGTGGYNSQNQYVYSGGLTGTGTILIDTNAELDVDRAVDPASGNTITFASGSTGGVLYLDPQTLTAAGAFLPVIAGFGPADLIEYGGTVTSATYAGGVLTLHNGTSTVATLTLTGNYANASFFANALPSGGTQISVSTGGDTATAPTGTASADQYVWGASIAGSWDVPGNWIDTTNGANPAAVAPGLHDLVAIAAAAGVIDVVTGTGNAASLTLSGSVDLKGHFSTAAVALSGTTLVDAAASLTDSGDLVNAASYASLTVAGGTLTVTGNVVDYYYDRQTLNGGTITVGGIKASASNSSLYVGSSYTVTAGSYTVTGSIAETGTSVSVSGGSFTAKGTTDLGGDDFSTSGSGTIRLYAVLPTAGSSDNFYVSDNSSIEIGTTGGAAAGSFTLDQATSLIDGGSIYAPHIVINGTLEVGAGQTLQLVGGTGGYNSQNQYVYSGGLTGTGTILIDTNAELDVDRAVDPASGNTITFASGSTGGVLYLDPQTLTAAGAFLPVIAGFGPADLIEYGGTVTSATYAGGVLTLHNGTSTVATLTLTGNFSGQSFKTVAINAGTQITVGTTQTVSVASYLANRSTLDGNANGFAVSDTAANIAANIDSFGDSNIDTIIVSDSATVAVTVAQVSNDALALGKLVNASGQPTFLTVKDTSANILAGLSTLQQAMPLVHSIVATGAVSVTAYTAASYPGVLAEISSGFTVKDTGSSIAAYLDRLNISNLTSITISDNQPVGVSVAQLTTDAPAIGVLKNANGKSPQLAVSDTAANIVAGLSTLQADQAVIGSITVTDAPSLTLTYQQYAPNSAALAKVGSATTFTLTNVPADNLASVELDSHVTVIGLTGGTLGTVKLGGATLTNSGTLTQTGTVTVTSATITNQVGASWALTGSSAIALASGGSGGFVNAGTLAKTSGASSAIGVNVTDTGTVSVASGSVLAFNGASNSFAGAFTGSGTASFGGGGADAFNSGISMGTGGWTVTGTGTVATIATTLSYGGAFSLQNAATLTLTKALTLSGTDLIGLSTVRGTAGLTTSGNTTVGTAMLAGTVAWQNYGTVTATGALTMGDPAAQKSTFTNATSGTYNITGPGGIVLGGGTTSLFTNAGLLERTVGTGPVKIGVRVVDTGTVNVATGTLEFDGAGSTFAGAIKGAGTVAFGSMTGETLGAGTSLSVAALSVVSGGRLTVATSLSYAGTLTEASGALLALGANTLTLTGADTIAGTIAGTATLAFDHATVALNLGTKITAAHVSIVDGTALTLGTNVSLPSALNESGSTVNLNKHVLTATGAATFTGGTINGAGTASGAGTLSLKGAATLSGLTVDGGATLALYGATTETGGLTLGDSGGGTAILVNEAGAIFSIGDNTGIAAAATGSGRITNAGTLIKTAGAGTSLIGPAVTNNGTIEAAVGTLALAGALTGGGQLLIDSSARLDLAGTVGSASKVVFQPGTGSGTTLQLDNAPAFAGTVSGFGAGDTMDLTSIGFSGNTQLSYKDTTSGGKNSGTLTVMDGTHTANIHMLGTYTLASFSPALDSMASHGTAITFHA